MGKKPRIAVSAVILDRGKILLVKRATSPSKGKWALPGGKVEYGERMAEAVRREVREEVGLDIEPICVFRIVEIVCPERGYHFVLAVFLARLKGVNTLRINKEEVEKAVWLHPSQALRLDLTVSTRKLIERILSMKDLSKLSPKPEVYSFSQKTVGILNLCQG